ncbi:MAG: rcp1 [Bacteroidetes bacterium]|jgi:CheY-like chemotaxis protein|nr:rcp1 [Bacteroidota bacterium]
MVFIIDDDKDDLELIAAAYREVNKNEKLKLFETSLDFLAFTSDPKNAGIIPSYVISDLKMPAMDGIRMIERLRKQHSYETIPVIMLSTSSLISDLERSYNAGVNCFLIKPDTYNGWKSTVSTVQTWVKRWYASVGV